MSVQIVVMVNRSDGALTAAFLEPIDDPGIGRVWSGYTVGRSAGPLDVASSVQLGNVVAELEQRLDAGIARVAVAASRGEG